MPFQWSKHLYCISFAFFYRKKLFIFSTVLKWKLTTLKLYTFLVSYITIKHKTFFFFYFVKNSKKSKENFFIYKIEFVISLFLLTRTIFWNEFNFIFFEFSSFFFFFFCYSTILKINSWCDQWFFKSTKIKFVFMSIFLLIIFHFCGFRLFVRTFD